MEEVLLHVHLLSHVQVVLGLLQIVLLVFQEQEEIHLILVDVGLDIIRMEIMQIVEHVVIVVQHVHHHQIVQDVNQIDLVLVVIVRLVIMKIVVKIVSDVYIHVKIVHHIQIVKVAKQQQIEIVHVDAMQVIMITIHLVLVVTIQNVPLVVGLPPLVLKIVILDVKHVIPQVLVHHVIQVNI